MIKRSDMRRNWTHRCSSSHCSQNCSNSSNPPRNSHHCYSYHRQGRPQGAGTPPDTALHIPKYSFFSTTTRLSAGIAEAFPSVPPPAAYAAIGCSKKTDAPMLQFATLAELFKPKQSAPQCAPPLQPPPTRATAVIPSFQ